MSTADQLTTYTELAQVIDNLPILVRERRRQMRLSLRTAAKQCGLSAATLSRFERGQDLDGKNLRRILRWLDSAPESPTDAPTAPTRPDDTHQPHNGQETTP